MERMFFGDAVMKYPKQWIVLVNVAWEGLSIKIIKN